MKVSSINNSYLQPKEYKRFSFTPGHSENKPKEDKLAAFTKKEMEENGFVFDDKTPQFLIGIDFSEESKQMLKDKKEYTEVTKKVELVFIDMIYRKMFSEPKMVWRGEAVSVAGPELDSVDIEKCLVIGLVQSYPDRFKSAEKNVRQSSCKK